MKHLASLACLLLLVSCALKLKGLQEQKTHSQPLELSEMQARINQLGYHPQAVKKAVLFGGEDLSEFSIKNKDQGEVFKGKLEAQKLWTPSMENVRQLDFSALTEEGEYAVFIDTTRVSPWFPIHAEAYEEMGKASLKWFYYQRASAELPEEYAGKFARKAGHPDTQVFFHQGLEKEGTLKSPKGWYDAGDYGKYITNSNISTYTLLNLFASHPESLKEWAWNIPPEGSLPDLLAEAKYNLDWMLTMQDRDGGVYHKLTTLKFAGDVMPDADKAPRYAIGKSATATFGYAAVMAYASRIYRPLDPTFANLCRGAAIRAYDWAILNQEKLFVQPHDVESGAYKDDHVDDEKMWAAVELYLLTKEENYLAEAKAGSFSGKLPWWGQVDGLAIYSILEASEVDPGLKKQAKNALSTLANKLSSKAHYEAYPNAMAEENFVWGSNSSVANQGIVLWQAYRHLGEEKYLKAAQFSLDYLLGTNPLNTSYITGFGFYSPMHPHHRPSTADGISAPIPGMLVGGPHLGGQDVGDKVWHCKEYRKDAATSYVDQHCSYATNEVAINWNAPLAFLSIALELTYRDPKTH